MRTEKEFLNTAETYIKVTIDRLKDGRIITAYEELGLLLKMTQQRLQEIEGTAAPAGNRRNRSMADRAGSRPVEKADGRQKGGRRMSLYICDPKKHPRCIDKEICQTFCFMTTHPEWSTDGIELTEEDINREEEQRRRRKRPAYIRTDGLAPDLATFEPLLIEKEEPKT